MNYENRFHEIPPHTYPLALKCTAALCIVIFCLFFFDLPHFIDIDKKYKKAEFAFKRENYYVAFKEFSTLNEQLPNRDRIKFRLAQMLFLKEDANAHREAMDYLKDMSLGMHDWNQLLKYMPSEYIELFDTVEVKS